VFTALLGPVSVGRWPARRDLLLAMAAFAGVAVIVGRVDLTEATTQGALWGVTASALFAVLTILNERLIVGYAGLTVAFYQFGVAALVLAPFSAGELGSVDGRDWLLLVLFGTLITGVPHTLFIASMRRFSSTTASLTVSLEPVYGITLAWLILSEVPSPRVLVGGAMIVATVIAGSRH
jgi:drug/metabolite transporter (DMT)-like permease